MIKKFVTWLYLKVVYLPEFKKKVERMYPNAEITYSTRIEEDQGDGLVGVIVDQERVMRQAWFERERIPDAHLH